VRSPSLPQVLAKQEEQNIKPKIEFLQCDTFSLVEELKQRNLATKFDLVTIGRALHWFDHYKLFEYLNQHLLENQGTLCILGDQSSDCEYNVTDPDFRNKAQRHLVKFRATIRPYWKIKSQPDPNLLKHADVDFTKYYKNVIREECVQVQPLTLEDFLGHVRTYSSYNCCVAETSHEKDFVDPAELLREDFEKDMKEYFEKTGEKLSECPILNVVTFLYIECSNK